MIRWLIRLAVVGLLVVAFCAPALADPRAEHIGERYLGTPYVFGGHSRLGVDCDGFTRMVYAREGINIGPSYLNQIYAGRPVARANLRVGDLVFFNDGTFGRYRGISHVGIYAGRGQVLHASSYFGRVVISPMRYLGGFEGGVRVR